MAERGSSTLPEEDAGSAIRTDRTLRFALYALLAVTVAASLTGRLGVTTATVSADGGGYSLAVHHATVTRPGLASPFTVTIGAEGGLPPEVEVVLSSGYLAGFDQNGITPIPASSFVDGELASWTFEVPPGATRLTVMLDARIEPAVQGRLRGEVSVRDAGRTVVGVGFTTTVMP